MALVHLKAEDLNLFSDDDSSEEEVEVNVPLFMQTKKKHDFLDFAGKSKKQIMEMPQNEKKKLINKFISSGKEQDKKYSSVDKTDSKKRGISYFKAVSDDALDEYYQIDVKDLPEDTAFKLVQ